MWAEQLLVQALLQAPLLHLVVRALVQELALLQAPLLHLVIRALVQELVQALLEDALVQELLQVRLVEVPRGGRSRQGAHVARRHATRSSHCPAHQSQPSQGLQGGLSQGQGLPACSSSRDMVQGLLQDLPTAERQRAVAGTGTQAATLQARVGDLGSRRWPTLQEPMLGAGARPGACGPPGATELCLHSCIECSGNTCMPYRYNEHMSILLDGYDQYMYEYVYMLTPCLRRRIYMSMCMYLCVATYICSQYCILVSQLYAAIIQKY